jgi:formylglycine-generating enzyme required for sulfatase activity
MGKFQVTQAEYEAVMSVNPSNFKGANLPVENVSWEGANRFCEVLNSKNDGYRYRLPREAEWEYAARAEDTSRRFDNAPQVKRIRLPVLGQNLARLVFRRI